MNDSNLPNQRLFAFTIADLAVMASALSLATATAMMYGKEGGQAKSRLKQLTEMFNELCPISKTHRAKEYAWFDAFAAVANAKAYHLRIEAFARYGWRVDAARIIMIVDDKSYALTEDLSFGDDAKGVIPKSYTKMFDDTLALVNEAAAMDAEFMQDCVIQFPIKLDKEDHRRRGVQEKEVATTTIKKALKMAGITDIPFAVREVEYATDRDETSFYDVSVLIRPSDEARFKDLFTVEPISAPAP
jgi:hypothetical protein